MASLMACSLLVMLKNWLVFVTAWGPEMAASTGIWQKTLAFHLLSLLWLWGKKHSLPKEAAD
jgi:hypothetical protein